MQASLLDWEPRYPESPGYKAEGASQEAAHAVKESAKSIRAAAYKLLCEHLDGLTVGDFLDKGFAEKGIKPRLSELVKDGRAEKAGRRKHHSSKIALTVYRVSQNAGAAQ